MPQFLHNFIQRESLTDDEPRRLSLAAGLWIGLLLSSLSPLGCSRSEPASPSSTPLIAPPRVTDEGIDAEVASAIEAASTEVKAKPTDGNRWGELGLIFYAHDFLGQATQCFQQAAILAPQDGRWPYLQARTIAAHRPKEAAELLGHAVELCGNNPPAVRLYRVELLLELMQLNEAESELAAFLAEAPSDGRAQLSQARLLFMRERYQDCLDTLKTLDADLTSANEQRGRRQPLYLLAAASLRRLGNAEQAEQMRKQAMDQAESTWPDKYMAEVRKRKTGLKSYLVNADRLYNRGQYEQSIKILRETVSKYPESLWGKILLGRALIRTGGPSSSLSREEKQRRLVAAVQILEAAIQENPHAVEAYFRLAVAKDYLQDPESAIELYQQVIQQKPDFTMAHYNLASCLNRKRDIDGAIRALQASVQAEPEFTDGHHMLGRLFVAQRRYAEAANHLRIATQLDPNNAQIAERYRSALKKSQVPGE